MKFWTTVKNYTVTGFSVLGRVVTNAGQTFYSMIKTVDYFHGQNHPAGTTATAIAVIGTAGSMVLSKTVPTYDQIANPKLDDRNIIPLKSAGKIIDYGLRGSGFLYGIMTSVAAFFTTVQLSQALNSVLTDESSEAELEQWKDITVQVCAGLVAIANLYNYFSNDYRFIKKNTHMMAESIDQGHIALNAAMAKTLAASSLNLITYPMQTFFFAKPAIATLPFIGEKLGPMSQGILTGASCLFTFFTIVSWMPSVYTQFADTTQDADQETIPDNCKTISYKIAAYSMGTIDSIGGNGLGPFISTIFTMSQFGADEYSGWVIAPAIIFALNSAIINMMFSAKEGVDTTLDILQRRSKEPEQESLLKNGKALVIYTGENPSRDTLFQALSPVSPRHQETTTLSARPRLY